MRDHAKEAALATTRFAATTEYLDGIGVEYELVEHAPTASAAGEARAVGRRPDEVAKTVVLRDGDACVIAAIPASERLDLRKLREVAGASHHLRLADEDEIAREFPSFEVGAAPPFGPFVPAAEVIDSSLLGHERALFPAGDHRHGVLVDPREVLRITGALAADVCED